TQPQAQETIIMKNFKSFIALAVLASLTLNAINAHAYALNEFATGAYATASGISVRVSTLTHAPATQIAVTLQYPLITDGKLDRSRITTVDLPPLTPGSTVLPTPHQAHNCWAFVITNVDQFNMQIKAFWVY